MSIAVAQRASDSPYVETVMHGVTLSAGAPTRPAERHWHMVFSNHAGRTLALLVGPWRTAGQVVYAADAELLWIKFKPGVFMPHLPTQRLVDREITLPDTTSHKLWLHSSAWELPNYENADTFVNRLIRDGVLVYDQAVGAALRNERQQVPDRTLRHRFIQATGLTQSYIRQVERAQYAAMLLQQGTSIADTVFEAGYYDQPHLTRSLKQFIGSTPAQLASARQPA